MADCHGLDLNFMQKICSALHVYCAIIVPAYCTHVYVLILCVAWHTRICYLKPSTGIKRFYHLDQTND